MPGTSLLLVEDDPALAGYLAAALADASFDVSQAADRATARGIITSKQPPMLLLLDLGLPPRPSTMTEGLALLDECLLLSPATKIIVLTGQDEQQAARAAVRRGAFDFLVKPAALNAILQALRRAELFAREEALMAEDGAASLRVTTRPGEGLRQAAAAAEEQLIRLTLKEAGHNVAEAARRLGMSREHVYYYLNKYGIRRPG